MTRFRLSALACFSVFTCLLAITAQPAFGQLSDSGLDQFGTFQRNNIQTMNMYNLNNHLEIPAFEKKSAVSASPQELSATSLIPLW